jgi:hypothetical protein
VIEHADNVRAPAVAVVEEVAGSTEQNIANRSNVYTSGIRR